MGVFLHLSISPHQISAEDWKSVYAETLNLLEKFPFLDVESNENGYLYAQPSAHREDIIGRYAGWRVCGDMISGDTTEYFYLVDDIEYYRENGGGVWCGKTQGAPAHIPLLAIACLICHRFPDSTKVSGDISASQCRRAVGWANHYLEVPIDVPIDAEFERLLTALYADGVDDEALLDSFFERTLQACTAEMGAFLKERLASSLLESYYKKELIEAWKHDEVRLVWLMECVEEYLELQLDFHTLCCLILDPSEGIGLEPRVFMEKLLTRNLHVPVEERGHCDTKRSHVSRDDGGVDTVQSLLEMALAAFMRARKPNVNAYLPLEQICAGFESALGSGDYMSMAQELLQDRQNAMGHDLQNLLSSGADGYVEQSSEVCEKSDETDTYEISTMRETILYREGDTIAPHIHGKLLSFMRQLRELCNDEFMDDFLNMSEEERKRWFYEHYKILIPKEIEDMFFSRIMDNDYIRRYVVLYGVRVDLRIEAEVRALLWNPELLDSYWMLSTEEVEQTGLGTDGEGEAR